jgi:hypothetical protein
LRARFGDALTRIAGRASALARVLAEEVMSACYEVVGAPGEDHGSVPDSGFAEELPDAVTFCPRTMHDIFEGAVKADHAKVICVTEFGLTCVKKRDPDLSSREYGAHSDPELGAHEVEEDLMERTILLKPKVLLDTAQSLF